MEIDGRAVGGRQQVGVGVQESSRAMKPLHRRWWGHGALGSTLLVFSDAAGEAAELGEAGPDHGLEHQVGRGAGASMSPSRCSWRLWQMGPASHPSPEALAAAAGSFLLGLLRKSVPLPDRSSWHPHMETKRGRAGPLGWLSWCEVCPLSPWPPPGSCCENASSRRVVELAGSKSACSQPGGGRCSAALLAGLKDSPVCTEGGIVLELIPVRCS